MRIALCKARFAGPVSGADETLVTYASRLCAAGHDVEVVTLFPYSTRDPYFRRLRRAGVPVRTIVERAWLFSLLQSVRAAATHALFVFVLLYSFASHMRGLWTSILHFVSRLYLHRCIRFFTANRYDVVHILTPDSGTPVLIRACHAQGIRTLYQELGSPLHPEADRHYRRLARVIPLCTSVVALSPKLAEQWAERFRHPGGIGVLPLLCERPAAWPIPRRPMPFDVVFGFSGRLEPLKGTLALLAAFARLGPSHARPFLRIAGEGPEAYKARRLSSDLGIADACDYVGRYNSLEGRSAFFGTLDVFVLPTRTEGTPNSIIEAMAAGIPVIASGVGGIPDMLSPDTGIIVPPGDQDALVAAMRRLGQDSALRERLGAAARRRYERLFGPDAVLPMLIERYHAVIAAEPQAAKLGIIPGSHPWSATGPAMSRAASA
ncbi:glycosyltransferase [Sphingomonas parva]|nr:glycosyltransferase [Sphingomonas parva]